MIIFVILTVVEGYFPEISSKAPEISSPCLCHLRPPCPPPYYCPISVVCPPPQPIICPPPCPPVKPPSCPVIPCPAAPPCPIFCPPIPPCPPPVIRCPRTCPPALPPSPSPPAYLPLQYDNKFPHTDFAATPYFSSHQNNNKGRYGYGNCVINGPSGSILDQQHFDFPSEATTMENIHFPSISESNLQVEPSIIDHETKQTSTANFANIDADLTTTLPDISELQQESEIKSDQHSLFQLLNIEKTNYTTQAAYTSQKTERKYFIRNGCPPNDSSCIDNDDSGTLPEVIDNLILHIE
ncbi:unnamed protein product [Thelazia callipaeda]|uniref:EB domain-containing protein n=1 Tax=Thelazia callipaeda TaxID=103827 RepID=A0A0N5CP68_THECL|nr:unnamed protein product [Thelazia callipaeda]